MSNSTSVSLSDSMSELVSESISDSVSKSLKESNSESVSDSVIKSISESVSESVSESISTSVRWSQSLSMSEEGSTSHSESISLESMSGKQLQRSGILPNTGEESSAWTSLLGLVCLEPSCSLEACSNDEKNKKKQSLRTSSAMFLKIPRPCDEVFCMSEVTTYPLVFTTY
ncbi:TPA: LPXTG cell wall anchor domain-containing protein [Streptococcus suis]